MLKAILFLSLCGTSLALTYRVDNYYTDSACTKVNWGHYMRVKSVIMGCVAASTSRKFEKVVGGYNTTYFLTKNCTGPLDSGPTKNPEFKADSPCINFTRDNGDFGFIKTEWKESVPVAAAEIPKGHVADFKYKETTHSDKCNAEISSANYYKLGACSVGSPTGRTSGIYSISTNDATNIMFSSNCAVPETSSLDFTTDCTDNKGQYERGVLGTYTEPTSTLSTASSFKYVEVTAALASMVLLFL